MVHFVFGDCHFVADIKDSDLVKYKICSWFIDISRNTTKLYTALVTKSFCISPHIEVNYTYIVLLLIASTLDI